MTSSFKKVELGQAPIAVSKTRTFALSITAFSMLQQFAAQCCTFYYAKTIN